MKSCPGQARHAPEIKRWLCAGALGRAQQYIYSKWHSCHRVSPRIGQLNRSDVRVGLSQITSYPLSDTQALESRP